MTSEAADKIEEDKIRAAEEWANQMEAEDEESDESDDPTKNPENVKWMEEVMAQNKSVFGDDFGDDLSLDFNE
jgi:hypothetical protein